MPELHIDISEQNKQIFEPIAWQTIHKTLREIGANRKVDDRIYADFNYTTVKSRTVKSMDASLRKNKVYVGVDINTAPDAGRFHNFNFYHAPNTGFTRNDERIMKPLFFDIDGPIRIYENFAPVSITMNYTFAFVERSTIAGLAGILRNRFGNVGYVETTDVTYHYPIPPLLIKVLFDLYSLKNIPERFIHYLKRNSNYHITSLVNRTQTKMQLVAQRTQAEVNSVYEFSDERPDIQKSNKVTDTYELKLTHNLQLSIPNSVYLEYPIIVNNNMVSGEYLEANTDYVKPLQSLRQTTNVEMFGETQDRRISKLREPIILPSYDDWIVPYRALAKKFSYQEFYIAAFTFNEDTDAEGNVIKVRNDQQFYILDYEQMGDYIFHPIIDHFLLLQGPESLYRDALFNVTVYKDNYPLDGKFTTMDHYGNIFVNTNDNKSIHRLVISEICDITKLNPKWIDPLIEWIRGCYSTGKIECCPPLKVIEDLYYYLRSGGSLDSLRLTCPDNYHFIKLRTLINVIKNLDYSNMDIQLAKYKRGE